LISHATFSSDAVVLICDYLYFVASAISRHFRFGHPRSVASYNSETARESNFFVALVAHHDTRTGDPNCG
jgi:hypothetical protein